MKQRLLLLASLILLSSCGKRSHRKPPPTVAPIVKVAQVKKRQLYGGLEATGTIKADQQVNLSFSVPGRIQRFYVEEGSVVKKGSPLARLSCTTQVQGIKIAKANLESAKASLAKVKQGSTIEQKEEQWQRVEQAKVNMEQAKANLQRQKELFEKKLVSDQVVEDATFALQKAKSFYDEMVWTAKQLESLPKKEDVQVAQAAVLQAKAQLDKTRADLGDCTLRAPFTGIWVGQRKEVGSFVQMGEPVGLLLSRNKIEVEVDMPEAKAKDVFVGQKVLVTIDALKLERVGKVSLVERHVKQQSRTFRVKVSLEAVTPAMMPGLFVRLLFVLKSQRMPALPGKALVGKRTVFVIKNGKAAERKVEIGLAGEEWIGVSRGVEPGEWVVVVGQIGLKNGDRVAAQRLKERELKQLE